MSLAGPLSRRDLLLAAATSPVLAAASPAWWSGDVAHLIPSARHDALLLKASFVHQHTRVRLHVSGKRVLGRRQDSAGRFHAFHVEGLSPDTEHLLQLFGADGRPLCDPWPLRTFPAPGARAERFRLLAYTCAGGSDMSRHPTLGPLFLPLQTRRRLLARAMALRPDAVIANGDHIYWDLRSASAAVQGRSPEALREVGAFSRDEPLLEHPMSGCSSMRSDRRSPASMGPRCDPVPASSCSTITTTRTMTRRTGLPVPSLPTGS
jgi:hypothetical protein